MEMRRFAKSSALIFMASFFAPIFEALAAEPRARIVASKEHGWPQFRGPTRDGISTERNLRQTWPTNGPSLLWSAKNFGRGFSSPIIANDRLYFTGDVGNDLKIFAVDLTGQPVWTVTNGMAWNRDYPGARSSVTFSEGRLYHQNAHGRLVCLDANTGQEQWAVNLLEEFGGDNITWGLSECVLVDDRAVYVTPGGRKALVAALDKKSGKVIWTTDSWPSSLDASKPDAASYASPILVKFGERRLLVGCSSRNLYCIDAASGKMQFTRPMPTSYSVLAAMPALVGDSIFMTAPHGKGGVLYRLTAGETIGAEELWRSPLDTCQGGVILHEGKLIGSFYPGRKGWAAIDIKNGEILYQQPDFIKGAAVFADNRLYVLSEDGWMRLLEPSVSQFNVHGQFQLVKATGNDAWAHPVIWNGRLYLRYHETLYCYDIRQN